MRLDCDVIVSVTQTTAYANGDQRWTLRGRGCTAREAGTVVGHPPGGPLQ